MKTTLINQPIFIACQPGDPMLERVRTGDAALFETPVQTTFNGGRADDEVGIFDFVKPEKACISILTEQHFDMFNAIETGSAGLPKIEFAEQAFEWKFMSWVPYVYI